MPQPNSLPFQTPPPPKPPAQPAPHPTPPMQAKVVQGLRRSVAEIAGRKSEDITEIVILLSAAGVALTLALTLTPSSNPSPMHVLLPLSPQEPTRTGTRMVCSSSWLPS